MALIKCPECNHEMSDTAKVCPNCGYRACKKGAVQINAKVTGILITIVCVVAVILVIAGVIKKSKAKREETQKEESRKEKTQQGTDENSAEALRHYIEMLVNDGEIHEEIVAILGDNSSERELIRLNRNGIKFCLDTPKLQAVLTTEYGEQLNGSFFKSEKYKKQTFVVTIKTNGGSFGTMVNGKWEE